MLSRCEVAFPRLQERREGIFINKILHQKQNKKNSQMERLNNGI